MFSGKQIFLDFSDFSEKYKLTEKLLLITL